MKHTIPIIDNAFRRAGYVLTHVLPKLKGVWKNVLAKDITAAKDWVRAPREKRYWRRPVFL